MLVGHSESSGEESLNLDSSQRKRLARSYAWIGETPGTTSQQEPRDGKGDKSRGWVKW